MSIKSIVAQIKETISQLDELLGSTDLKEGKRADILMERSRLLTTLLAQENTDRQTTDEAKIKELTAQQEAAAKEIESLKTEVAELRVRAQQVIREVIPDPDHAAVREQNTALISILKLIAELMPEDERQQVVVHGIERLPSDAARLLCTLVGLNYVEQVQMFRAYTTAAQLRDVIQKAQREGPAVLFARAMLAIRHPDSVLAKPAAEGDWL